MGWRETERLKSSQKQNNNCSKVKSEAFPWVPIWFYFLTIALNISVWVKWTDISDPERNRPSCRECCPASVRFYLAVRMTANTRMLVNSMVWMWKCLPKVCMFKSWFLASHSYKVAELLSDKTLREVFRSHGTCPLFKGEMGAFPTPLSCSFSLPIMKWAIYLRHIFPLLSCIFCHHRLKP